MSQLSEVKKIIRWATFICLAAVSISYGQIIAVTADHKDGVYGVGAPIQWHIEVRGPNAAAVKQATFVIKRCGQTAVKNGTVDLSAGSADLSSSLDEPGTLLLDISAQTDGGVIRGLGGAAIGPDKIQPSSPRPDDFDAFWTDQIKRLQDIPAQPDLLAVDSPNSNIEYFKLQMNGISGSQIYGQLAKPKKDGKYPALLILQWAGVYGLQNSWVTGRARQGWLVLNIMPHDLPFDQPEAFYKRLGATTLSNYFTFGMHDRTTSYFLRMYMSAYRAADYLTGRPDWDGKTLVVMGTSQGGQQTIMLAGLHPKVTAMMALVPSSCDVTGREKGRAIGYPSWADTARQKNDPQILQTARYFDPVNFASHITCTALVSMGLLDETSPPSGVFSAINQMKGKTEVLVLPNSDHQGMLGAMHNAQMPYNRRSDQWLNAMVRGEAIPPVQ